MMDNECSGEEGELDEAMRELAKAWKDILKHFDAKIGIDPEFTRPGIECLLEQFAASLHENTSCAGHDYEYEFKWQ